MFRLRLWWRSLNEAYWFLNDFSGAAGAVVHFIATQKLIMKTTVPTGHGKAAFLYAFSKVLERAAYYGIRSLIVINMVSGTLSMDRTEALEIYAWFSMLVVFATLLGGIIGDLVVGNRKSIILGAVIQAAGAFTLCIPTTVGLYAGLTFVIIGGGLYVPNVTANFGKLYADKVKLLDSAFTLDYLAINIGAFSGIFLISYYGEEHGWASGFILAGVLMLASVAPIIISDEYVSDEPTGTGVSTSRGAVNIVFVVLVVAAFWLAYEMAGIRLEVVQSAMKGALATILPESLVSSYQSMISLPIMAIAIVLWTVSYSSYKFKLLLGFVFGAMSYGILLYLPEVPSEQHLTLYITSLVLLGMAEVHIAPMFGAVVTKYANPKYLAIMFGLVFIPSRVFSTWLGYFDKVLYGDPSKGLSAAMAIMTLLSIGLIILVSVRKSQS